MTDKLKVRLHHEDGAIRSDAVDTIVIVHGIHEFRIGMTQGRLEIWTSGPLAVRPIAGNTIAIERAP